MTVITSRAHSVYKGDSASEFCKWLQELFEGLTQEQRQKAEMELRCFTDGSGAMVGISYAETENG